MPKQGATARPGRLTKVRTAAKPATIAEKVAEEIPVPDGVLPESDEVVPQDPGDWNKPEYAQNATSTTDDDFDNLDDLDELVRVLYYGPEGTAKSTNVADMVNMAPEGNVLVINAEGGLRRTALANRGIDTSRIRVWPKKGEPLTFEGLERLFYRVQADLEEDPMSWIGWTWDSDTAIYQAMLDNVIDAVHRRAAEVLQRAGKGRSGRSGNITLPDRFESDLSDYYNKMSQQFRLLLRKWRSLDCHFAMTALLRRDEDKRSKKVQYGPAVSPAIATDVLAYVDVVVRTATADTPAGPVWWGRTHGTADERGKDRLGVLPHRMIEPTMSRIQDYLIGSLTEANDPLQVRFGEAVEQFEEEEAAKTAPKTVKPPRAAAKKPAPKAIETTEEPEVPEVPDDQAQAEETPAEAPKRPRARAARPAPAKPSAEKPVGGTAPVVRRASARKPDPKQAAAKATVTAETSPAKGGPASARVKANVRKAARSSPPVVPPGQSDKPPF